MQISNLVPIPRAMYLPANGVRRSYEALHHSGDISLVSSASQCSIVTGQLTSFPVESLLPLAQTNIQGVWIAGDTCYVLGKGDGSTLFRFNVNTPLVRESLPSYANRGETVVMMRDTGHAIAPTGNAIYFIGRNGNATGNFFEIVTRGRRVAALNLFTQRASAQRNPREIFLNNQTMSVGSVNATINVIVTIEQPEVDGTPPPVMRITTDTGTGAMTSVLAPGGITGFTSGFGNNAISDNANTIIARVGVVYHIWTRGTGTSTVYTHQGVVQLPVGGTITRIPGTQEFHVSSGFIIHNRGGTWTFGDTAPIIPREILPGNFAMFRTSNQMLEKVPLQDIETIEPIAKAVITPTITDTTQPTRVTLVTELETASGDRVDRVPRLYLENPSSDINFISANTVDFDDATSVDVRVRVVYGDTTGKATELGIEIKPLEVKAR